MTVLRCMDDKTCKIREKISMDIDNFDEGLKTCRTCLSDKRTSYSKHENKQKKHTRKMRNIEKNEAGLQ